MTSSLLLNTATPTFGELFTNGRTFAVPRFQRNYKWDEDQWEELWQDLIAAAESDKEHYMVPSFSKRMRHESTLKSLMVNSDW